MSPESVDEHDQSKNRGGGKKNLAVFYFLSGKCSVV